MSNDRNQENTILHEASKGYQSVIISKDKADILEAVKVFNDTFVHQVKHFYSLVDKQLDLQNTTIFESEKLVFGGYRIFRNFVSGKLMNDNTYAFSYSPELLDLDVESLMKRADVRIFYMQVDSMNKCVPQDWFLGYD